MNLKLRTIIIGIISLGGLLVMYLLYSGISQTPQIDIGRTTRLTESVSQSDAGDFDGELGKIGDVGVGTVEKFEYVHRNDSGDVDRKFGFRKLLLQSKGQWETDKPYMEVFLPVKCNITADKGRVQVEDAAGGLSIKDATFTGNVVMHILPEPASDIKESFIYLDDIAFDSKKSQFFTAGPVRFTSEDGQMQGRGMEFIYNEALGRVEFFRIVELDSFHLQLKTQNSKLKTPNGSDKTGSPPQADHGQGEYYRCIFCKNVVIDSPEHLVFADEKISINNIFWAKSSGQKTGEVAAVDSNNIEPVSTTASTATEPNKPVAEAGEIVITCDGGVIVTPMSSEQPPAEEKIENRKPVLSAAEGSKIENPGLRPGDAADRPTTVAQRIDYDVSTGDTILSGPVELDFYADMNDLVRAEPGKAILPVKITAQKEARFLAASKKVVLQGNCVATMLFEDPNVQQRYTLSAETFTIDLLEDISYQSRLQAGDIKYLTADGGVVTLTSFKAAGQELLGGVKLECRRIDYDAAGQLFVATGPGELMLNNSKVTDPTPKPGGFSLRKRCYAFLRYFDTLKYFMKTNQIVADAKPQETLRIDYFPIVQDQYGQQAVATAGLVQINLMQTADGRGTPLRGNPNELATLIASGGVTYEEYQGQDNQFAGSELFYDREQSILNVKGDESDPCYFNGALVRSITYNLKTGKVEAALAGPGAVQIKR